jgi:predicted RNase H-like nuclease (RuvC/YqgF family)
MLLSRLPNMPARRRKPHAKRKPTVESRRQIAMFRTELAACANHVRRLERRIDNLQETVASLREKIRS